MSKHNVKLDPVGVRCRLSRKGSGKGREAQLLWPYLAVIDDEEIIVPAGFETDFASVPRCLWGIIPPWGKYSEAAVVHDFLCRKDGYPRKRADKIFLILMEYLGVPFWKQRVMYRGVRIGAMWDAIKRRAKIFNRKG